MLIYYLTTAVIRIRYDSQWQVSLLEIYYRDSVTILKWGTPLTTNVVLLRDLVPL